MGLAATFSDADTFTVTGDYTADFVVNRKVRASCGVDGLKYVVVLSSSHADNTTTVNLTADSDDLTANLTEVHWSVVKPGTAGNIPLHSHTDEDAGGGNLLLPATILFINETANAKMTVGLTINQGANDDEFLAGKSSDVNHGMTTRAETDTFMNTKKVGADDGGAHIMGLTEATVAFYLDGYGVVDNTDKTTAAVAYILLQASKKSNSTSAAVGADGNLLVIRNYDEAHFIFDAEGSAHADVEWIAFDKEDDVALLTMLESEFARRKDPIKAEFGAFLDEGKEILQREKVVNFYDEGPRAMVNFTRLAMLHTGGIRQNALRITEGLASVLARLDRYEQALLQLGIQPQLLEG